MVGARRLNISWYYRETVLLLGSYWSLNELVQVRHRKTQANWTRSPICNGPFDSGPGFRPSHRASIHHTVPSVKKMRPGKQMTEMGPCMWVTIHSIPVHDLPSEDLRQRMYCNLRTLCMSSAATLYYPVNIVATVLVFGRR